MGRVQILSWIILSLCIVFVATQTVSNMPSRTPSNSATYTIQPYNASMTANVSAIVSPSINSSTIANYSVSPSINSTSVLPNATSSFNATPTASPGYVQSNYSSPSLSYNLVSNSSSVYFLIQSNLGNITVSGSTNSTYNVSVTSTTNSSSNPWVNLQVPSLWPQSYSSNLQTCVMPYVLCPDGTCLSPVAAAASSNLNTVCCGYGGNCQPNYQCSANQLMCPNSVCVNIPALPTNPISNSTLGNNNTSNSNYTVGGNNTVYNNNTMYGNNSVSSNSSINSNTTTRLNSKRADSNYDLTYFCCGHGGICPFSFALPNVTNTTIPINNNTTLPGTNTTMPNITIPTNNTGSNSSFILCPDGTYHNATLGNYTCCGYGGACPSVNSSASANMTMSASTLVNITLSPSANISASFNLSLSPSLNATMRNVSVTPTRIATFTMTPSPSMNSSSSADVIVVPKYQSAGWIVLWCLISVAGGIVIGAAIMYILFTRRDKFEFLNTPDKLDDL